MYNKIKDVNIYLLGIKPPTPYTGSALLINSEEEEKTIKLIMQHY